LKEQKENSLTVQPFGSQFFFSEIMKYNEPTGSKLALSIRISRAVSVEAVKISLG
jgi:hypothetical protein